uniref:non-specific serine/threonine protein kinase n=1 Tax=Schistosoma mansoni TaxID=6183 RepID=A0A3Q0KL97_SCHMA
MLKIDDHMTHELNDTFQDVSVSDIEDRNSASHSRQNLAGGTGVFANFFEEMAEPLSYQSSNLMDERQSTKCKQDCRTQTRSNEVNEGSSSMLRDEISPMEAFYGDNADDDLKILERYRMLVNSYSDSKPCRNDESQLRQLSHDDTLKRGGLPYGVTEYNPTDLSSQLCMSYIHRSKPPKVLANRFLLGSTIGRGSYGKVKDSIDLFTLRRHAVKIISKLGVRKIPGGWSQALHEASLMRRLSACRHVVSLVVVLRLENPDRLCLVMEHCLGSVHDLQASGVPSHTALSSENEFELDEFNAKSSSSQLPYFKHQHGQSSDAVLNENNSKDKGKNADSSEKLNKSRRFHPRLSIGSTQINQETDTKFDKSKSRKTSSIEQPRRKGTSSQQQQQFRRLPEAQAHAYFLQLIDGLHFLHRNGVIHRDIKPANLLLTPAPGCGLSGFGSPNGTMDLPDHNWLCSTGSQSAFCQRSLANLLALSRGWLVKLTDFGVSASISAFSTNDMVSGGQTTPAVQPPEVAKGVQSIFDGTKLDVYSAGVTLYFMLTGHVPFSCQNVLQIFEAIVKGDYTIPGYVSTNASDLIRKMMQKDPKKRLTLLQIRQQTWYIQDPPTPMPVESIKMKLRNELLHSQQLSNNESPTHTLFNSHKQQQQQQRGIICWLDPLIYLRRCHSEYPLPHIDDTGARIFNMDEIFNNSLNHTFTNSNDNDVQTSLSNMIINDKDEHLSNNHDDIAPISVIDRLKVFHDLDDYEEYSRPEDMSSFYYSPEACLQYSNVEKHLANLGIGSRLESDSTVINYPYVFNNVSMNYLHSASPIHLADESSRRSENICHPIDDVPYNVDNNNNNNNNNNQLNCYVLPSDQQQLTTHQFKQEKSLKSQMTPQPYWCLDLGVPVYEAINNMNDISEPPACPEDLPISIPSNYRLSKFAINPNVTNRTGSLPGPIAFIPSDLNIPQQIQNNINLNDNDERLNQKTWHYGSRPISNISKDLLKFTSSKQRHHDHQEPTKITTKDPDQISHNNNCNTNFDPTHINSTVNKQEQFVKTDYHSNRLNQWFSNPFNSFRNRIRSIRFKKDTSNHSQTITTTTTTNNNNNNNNNSNNKNGIRCYSPVVSTSTSTSSSSNTVYYRNVNSATELTSTIEVTPSSSPKIQIDDNSIKSTGTLPRARNRLKPCSRIFSRKKITGKK